MKILFVADTDPAETNTSVPRVAAVAAYWAAWGHQVTVITSCPDFPVGRIHPGDRNVWDGVRVIRVKTIPSNHGPLPRLLASLGVMVSAPLIGAWRPRPDVVVVSSPRFLAAVAGWLVGLRHLRPFVLEPGDLSPASIAATEAMRPGLRLVERLDLFLNRRAAAIAAPTPAFKAHLIARGIPPDKIVVIRNGDDLSRSPASPGDGDLASPPGLGNRLDAAAPRHTRRRQAEELIQLLEIVVAGYGNRASADRAAR